MRILKSTPAIKSQRLPPPQGKDHPYFEKRFDRRIQCLGSLLYIMKTVLWLPIAIYVPALTFNQVTGVNIHILTPIVCGICIFYTTVGGLKAVVFTDFLQSFIMFGTMFLIIIKGTLDVGGFGVVWQRNMDSGRIDIPELTFDPTVRMSMLSVVVGGTIFKLQGSAITQPAVQRFMALPSLNAVKKCLIYFSIGLTILIASCLYVGLVVFATYHDCDPLTTKLAKASDQLVPLLVMDVLGKYPGMAGIFVSAVFSAALSSMSTQLNSLSAVVLEDFAKPFSRHSLSEKQTAILMRTVVVIFGTASIGFVYVVEKLGMVLQLSATMESITQGPVMGTFFVGVCMPWVNSKSVLLGSVMSFISMTWICINAQILALRKEFISPVKPVSVEGCTYKFDYSPHMNSTLSEQPDVIESSHALYHISFLWYAALGAVLTIVFSNLAIIIFGRNKVEDIDASLVAPFLRKYYTDKKYESVEMMDKIGETQEL